MRPVLLVLAALAQSESTPDELYRDGAAHLRNGRVREAIAVFEQITRSSPNDARGWRGLGVAYASTGAYSAAQEPLTKACEMQPRHPDSCYHLGLANYHLGRYDVAKVAFEKALKTGVRIGRVHIGLGLVYEGMGRTDAAERELRAAMAEDDGQSQPDFDPKVEYGAFLLRQGRIDEAMKTLQNARTDSPRAHFEVARMLVQSNRLDEALSRLEQAIALHPSYAAAHLLLGKVYFRLDRMDDGDREIAIAERIMASKP